MTQEIATGEGRRPRLQLPPGSCECHSHIYEPAYPLLPGKQLRRLAPLASYEALLTRLGFDRSALAHSSAYGTDNSGTLDCIRKMGVHRARSTAVTPLDASDGELRRLHEGGIRGFRFSFGGGGFNVDDARHIAGRIAPLGWHLQVPTWQQDAAEGLGSLPVPVVVDHLGRIPPERGVDDPAFQGMLRAYEGGNFWIKISGPYYSSEGGPPHYEDFGARVRALAGIRTDRLVWGANWPHPTRPPHGEPEEADWLDAMLDWVPDEQDRQAVFVGNPAKLYDFPS